MKHLTTIRTRKNERNTKGGFTLAELLIVVAIIAVLVAIAIPIFTKQMEKSREATDLANIRSAYAVVTTEMMSGEYEKPQTVDLVQTQDGWIQGSTAEETLSALGTVEGSPTAGGKCVVSRKDAQDSEEPTVLFKFDGQASAAYNPNYNSPESVGKSIASALRSAISGGATTTNNIKGTCANLDGFPNTYKITVNGKQMPFSEYLLSVGIDISQDSFAAGSLYMSFDENGAPNGFGYVDDSKYQYELYGNDGTVEYVSKNDMLLWRDGPAWFAEHDK